MSKETTEALRFIMAFYEPGQTYLDTNAWKQAEAQARAALAEAEAPTDAQSASKSVQKRPSVQTGGEAPTVAQPVAALMRSRSVTTWPHLSVDGKTHYSEWGDWLPTTCKHAKEVTDPSRNADPVCYEMQPLYAAAPPQPVPLTEGAAMGIYMDFDRKADKAWSNAEYLTRFAQFVHDRAHGIGSKT